MAIKELIRNIANGNITDSGRDHLLAAVSIPIGKPDGDGKSIRPLAMGETLYKVCGGYLLEMEAQEVRKCFESVQLVFTPGGSEAAVHAIKAKLSEPNAHNILLSDDKPNAYNLRHRARMLRILFENPKLGSLLRFAHMAYSKPSDLFMRGADGKVAAHILSEEGAKQGDRLALFLFALSVQGPYMEAAMDPEVLAVGISDDLQMVGEEKRVFEAFDRLQAAEEAEGIQNKTDKRLVLWPHQQLPPASLIDECERRGIQLRAGNFRDEEGLEYGEVCGGGMAKVLGVPISHDPLRIDEWLLEKVKKHESFFEALELEGVSSQLAMLGLKHAGIPKFNYLSRVLSPDEYRKGGEAFQERLEISAAKILRLHGEEVKKVVQELRRPYRFGGGGLRSLVEVSDTAYATAAMQLASIPWVQLPHPNSAYFRAVEQARDRVLQQIDMEAPARLVEKELVTKSRVDQEEKAAGEFLEGDIPLQDVFQVVRQDSAQLKVKGLQKAVSAFLLYSSFDRVWEDFDVSTKARLRSSMARGASAWMGIPVSSAAWMASDLYRRAWRHRMGLFQADSLPGRCQFCSRNHDDPNHPLVCQQLRRSLRNLPHDAVQNILQHEMRNSCGLNVQGQPKYDRKLTDTMVVLDERVVEVDYVVTSPECKSHRIGAAEVNGAAAAKAYVGKEAAHLEHCEAVGNKLVPFAIETHGRVHPKSQLLLKEMAPLMGEVQQAQAIYRLRQLVSTSLQRGIGLAFKQYARFSMADMKRKGELRRRALSSFGRRFH